MFISSLVLPAKIIFAGGMHISIDSALKSSKCLVYVIQGKVHAVL
jgi:hypothetical protein